MIHGRIHFGEYSTNTDILIDTGSGSLVLPGKIYEIFFNSLEKSKIIIYQGPMDEHRFFPYNQTEHLPNIILTTSSGFVVVLRPQDDDTLVIPVVDTCVLLISGEQTTFIILGGYLLKTAAVEFGDGNKRIGLCQITRGPQTAENLESEPDRKPENPESEPDRKEFAKPCANWVLIVTWIVAYLAS